MIDQLTAAYLRSRNSQPVQSDLDQLLARTTSVRLMELVFDGRFGTFQPRMELIETAELSDLLNCLAIEASSGHLMTMGELALEFYHQNDLVARIEIVRTSVLRWPEQWKNDAYLLNPEKLAEFLKARGFSALSDQRERDAEAEKRSESAQAEWLATWEPAIPAGLAPLVEDLEREMYASEKTARPRALSILAAHYPSIDDQVLALFAWFGHGSGPWSGYPSSESAPECMLEAFTVAELLHALEGRQLTSQHLEGAARFVARWVPKKRRAHRKLLDLDQAKIPGRISALI